MISVTTLEAHLTRMDSVLLGYSGGVDSSLLAVVARRALGPGQFLAVIGRSPSYPAEHYRTALDIARTFEIPVLELDTRELEDPSYRANGTDRCFFCKQELWNRLEGVRIERGLHVIIDGTNADDLGEHRPGLRAAALLGVRSPLAELGWTKAEVRHAAAQLGIPSWSQPAAPCLSSRVQYGLEVTADRLRQVESAEARLRDWGVAGNLRVRHRGDHASVEVDAEWLPQLTRRWEEVLGLLRAAGFPRAELDPRGYRRGSLLRELPVAGG